MATAWKPCQAEETEECNNEARALCFHCERDLCLDHLTEHAQLVDALTRSALKDYSDALNQLYSHFQSLEIPSNLLTDPFIQLEQWRSNAHRMVDQIANKIHQKLQFQIDEYRHIFCVMRTEQLEKITRDKQKVAHLFRRAQVANHDLSDLRASIEQTQTYLTSLEKHTIEVVSNRPSLHSIHIHSRLFDEYLSCSSPSPSSISSITRQLEFCIKYVRLTGIRTCHYVLIETNGTIGDLIDQFIEQFDEKNSTKMKREYLLVTEVCQRRVRRRLTDDIRVEAIFNKIEQLVFYQTPFELTSSNLQRKCLIFCRFQDGLPWDIQFGLPILLKIPRLKCRGRNLLDVLNKTLIECFPPMAMSISHVQYAVNLVSDDHQIATTTILNEWADKQIDDRLLTADNATLVVDIIGARASEKKQTQSTGLKKETNFKES